MDMYCRDSVESDHGTYASYPQYSHSAHKFGAYEECSRAHPRSWKLGSESCALYRPSVGRLDLREGNARRYGGHGVVVLSIRGGRSGFGMEFHYETTCCALMIGARTRSMPREKYKPLRRNNALLAPAVGGTRLAQILHFLLVTRLVHSHKHCKRHAALPSPGSRTHHG